MAPSECHISSYLEVMDLINRSTDSWRSALCYLSWVHRDLTEKTSSKIIRTEKMDFFENFASKSYPLQFFDPVKILALKYVVFSLVFNAK